jgi:hypothetical protein
MRSQVPYRRALRLTLWLNQALRDRSATVRFARNQGFQTLKITDRSIFGGKGPNTLFILAGGSSINSMSARHFSEIRTGCSIGVNFWFFHDFIPDVYSFDAGAVPDRDKINLTETLRQLGVVFHRNEVISRAPAIIILRPHRLNLDDLIPLPQSLWSRIRVSGRANFLRTSHKDLGVDIQLVTKALRRQLVPNSILPDNGASVVRLIFLGLAQRFDNIVLVGVDLDESPHFWEESIYKAKHANLIARISNSDNLQHATTSSENRALGNREFLVLLSEISQQKFATKLWVSSEKSTLYPQIPVFPWGAKA